MPPKAKISPEEKQRLFDEWKSTSAEFAAVQKFITVRESQPHTAQPDNAWTDISDDFQPFLNALWEVGEVWKVPGRKCKCKFLTKHCNNTERAQ